MGGHLKCEKLLEAYRHNAGKEVICFLVKKLEYITFDTFLQITTELEQDPPMIDLLAGKVQSRGIGDWLQLNWGQRDNTHKNTYICADGTVNLGLIQRIAKITPKLKGFHSTTCKTWTVEALVEFAKVISQSEKIQSIVLKVPSKVVLESSSTPPRGAQMFQIVKDLTAAAAATTKNSCGVQRAELHCPAGSEHVMPFLRCLVHWPQLTSLRIGFQSNSRMALAMPALAHVLTTSGNLKSLEIEFPKNTGRGSLFLRGCQPILEALRKNSTLTSLAIGYNRGNQQIVLEAEAKVAKILQEDNATLTAVSLRHYYRGEERPWTNRDDGRYWYGNIRQREIATKIDYYVALNSAGRSVVRHSDETRLSLAKFVNLLAAPADRAKRETGRSTKAILHANATILQYGLLREVPGYWSNIVLSKGAMRRKMPAASCGRKRAYTSPPPKKASPSSTEPKSKRRRKQTARKAPISCPRWSKMI